MQSIKSELLELLRRNDLMRSSLLIGRVQNASFGSEIYVDRLMELASRAWQKSVRVKHDSILKAENINTVLFREYGLEGKNEKYKQVIDDPHRYYIHSVMDKRAGSPLSFAVIYSIMAEQMGLDFEVLALPAHYLIKINDGATEFYIDPFDSGKFLTADEFHKRFRTAMQRNRMMSANLFEKVTHMQLVARLVQQLKHIYILKGNAVEALRSVEILTCIFPESPELTRDRGILYCEMEYFSKAMDDLRFYLQARPNAEDVAEIKKLTTMLRGYREIIN